MKKDEKALNAEKSCRGSRISEEDLAFGDLRPLNPSTTSLNTSMKDSI
jgi:hypothetical protein